MTCHSNFCSLYDCRNFIKEVSSYSKQGNFNFYNIITKDIPDLVRHCIDNEKNKIYNVFGEYKLNRLYVINDFVLNANNHLFKAKNKKKETVYLITTEIALLVLQQYKKEDKGKLLLYNELRHFDKFESVCESQDKISVEIIWANQKSKIDKELYHFTKQNFELLKEDVVKKKKSILSQFTHFIENKPENKISDTLNLIKRKEEEYNNSKDTDNKEQMMSDLIHLYQQGIELLNEKGDSRYMEYIQKFKNLVEHQK